MILLSELSRRRVRSINKLIRIGRNEVVVVLRVDKDKGYIDLSKRRVSPEDIKKCEEKFNKSKTVHSIMKHVAEVHHKRLEDLYKQFGWPLYKKFGHAFDAFKLALQEPDKVFEGLDIDPQIKSTLLENIQRRLTPKAVKVRADIEVTCFSYEGIDSIKAALKAGQSAGTEEEPLSIKLVAPPLYVMTLTCLDKDKGIQLLEKSIQLIRDKITSLGGELVVKVPPRSVTERDDKELSNMMEEMERLNREVPGDDDTSDDEVPNAENQD